MMTNECEIVWNVKFDSHGYNATPNMEVVNNPRLFSLAYISQQHGHQVQAWFRVKSRKNSATKVNPKYLKCWGVWNANTPIAFLFADALHKVVIFCRCGMMRLPHEHNNGLTGVTGGMDLWKSKSIEIIKKYANLFQKHNNSPLSTG